MPTNLCYPYYEPGQRITGQATAAVTGKRFVRVSGNRGPVGLTTSVAGGNVLVAHAAAGGPALGVAEHDAASGDKVGVITTGATVPVTAGAAIGFGDEVESDASGRAIPLATGKPLGYALADAGNGTDAQIKLY